MTVAQAKQLLTDKGIMLAAILSIETISDTANAYVFRQNPEVDNFDSTLIIFNPDKRWISGYNLNLL